ncbi:MAG: YafY family protein [Alphaproteobacteria bacterium]
MTRRADRLFDIIQLLRGSGLMRARDLAQELEVSDRTIYRDIADLMASGVPIEGEAGLGYLLRDGYDLPPLMFTEDELEALVLGARMVQSWTDPDLATIAARALSKIDAVLPDHLQRFREDSMMLAPKRKTWGDMALIMRDLRGVVRTRKKLSIAYTDARDRTTERIVRPLGLSMYGPEWHLAGWCEMRNDFRTFRLDRVKDYSVLDVVFKDEAGKRLKDYFNRYVEDC